MYEFEYSFMPLGGNHNSSPVQDQTILYSKFLFSECPIGLQDIGYFLDGAWPMLGDSMCEHCKLIIFLFS